MIRYKIAYYKGFERTALIDKTVAFLERGDFVSAQSKKLVNTDYFRAKINYEDRLIFTFLNYRGESYILLLELVLNHEYEKSKFLKGINYLEEEITFVHEEAIEIDYMNPKREFLYINKFLSFSQEQENLLKFSPPILLVGSAGSGKTSVTIEKLRMLKGKILYTSLSKHLLENSQESCIDCSDVDFLTFSEFLNTIGKQSLKEVDFTLFKAWAYKHQIKEVEKYFEEFKGILTGTYEEAFYSKESYLALGIKQAIFAKEHREEVYAFFEKYLSWIEEEGYYDSNIEGYNLLPKVEKKYDFVVIDEVQDFTNMQIYFILQSLKNPQNFIFAGDSNQILYANFFSWTNLKTMLLKETEDNSRIQILKENYRNSKEITHLANKILKIKQLRFGSIDRESNYLANTASKVKGRIHYYKESKKVLKELSIETMNSIDFAIIVLDEKAKRKARSQFKTPLIFTVQEAKGLEYQNVIILNFVSGNAVKFNNMVAGIDKKDLEGDLVYRRQKDKENREIDSYKLYINALYVAFTRGIDNLYIVESKNHKVFELLGLIEEKKRKIEVKNSSKNAWEKEAKRLEKLGKTEQANEILEQISSPIQEKNISKKKVFSPKVKKHKKHKKQKKVRLEPDVGVLKQLVFEQKEASKENKDKLFRQAKKNNDFETIERLSAEYDFKSAKLYLNSLNTMSKKRTTPLPLGIDISSINLAEIINNESNLNMTFLRTAIENSVDLEIKDSEGETALLIAVKKNKKKIVKLLLEAGADVNVQDKQGMTALLISLALQLDDISQLLLDYGSDVSIESNEGSTALGIVIGHNDKKMIDILADKVPLSGFLSHIFKTLKSWFKLRRK